MDKMIMPNLFIPGFAKSGTSSLFDSLCNHPFISSGSTKEPHIYSSTDRFENRFNVKSEFSFDSVFKTQNRYVLDASTTYLIDPKSVERILSDCPKAKFIVIARDPVERIFSHFNWIQSKSVLVRKLKEEIELEMNKEWRFEDNIAGKFKYFWTFTKYGTQLEFLFKKVNRDSCLFLLYEDFKTDPQNELNKAFEFLNLDPVKVKQVYSNKTGQGVRLPLGVKKLSKFLPEALKAIVKSKIAQLQYVESSINDLNAIRSELHFEIEKLNQLGIDTSRWITTHSFLKS